MGVFITLSDIIGLTVLVLVLIVLAVFKIKTAFRQARCSHTGSIRETQACDAICGDCGKNLGFIGPWRERRKSQQ